MINLTDKATGALLISNGTPQEVQGFLGIGIGEVVEHLDGEPLHGRFIIETSRDFQRATASEVMRALVFRATTAKPKADRMIKALIMDELAALLEIQPDAARKRLDRAMDKLKACGKLRHFRSQLSELYQLRMRHGLDCDIEIEVEIEE